MIVDHLKDANLLGDRSHADSTRHPVNQHADNEEMIKAALVMGFGDRILRVRRGKIVKGIIKPNDLVILSEYVRYLQINIQGSLSFESFQSQEAWSGSHSARFSECRRKNQIRFHDLLQWDFFNGKESLW